MQSRVAVFDIQSLKPGKRENDRLTSVKLLMRNVQKPRKPRMTNPDNIHLISEMPEPAAYFAKERTRWEATKEKVVFFCCCVGKISMSRWWWGSYDSQRKAHI